MVKIKAFVIIARHILNVITWLTKEQCLNSYDSSGNFSEGYKIILISVIKRQKHETNSDKYNFSCCKIIQDVTDELVCYVHKITTVSNHD